MPRGQHPNSRANLKPFQKGLPTEAQRKNQLKGSATGNKAKQQLCNIKEIAKGCTNEKELQELFEQCKERAKHSDSSFELVLKILGMMPKTQIEVSAPLDDSIKEMEAYFEQSADTEAN